MLSLLERPAKRRRISHSETASSPSLRDGMSPSSPSLPGHSDPDEYDLPLGEPGDDSIIAEEREEIRINQQRSGPQNAIHVLPAHYKPLEKTFVTQLTQPASSPSRVRGPRWRKQSPIPASSTPSPSLSPERGTLRAQASLPSQAAETSQPSLVDDFFDEDELALAAALSFSDDDEAPSHDKVSSTMHAKNASHAKSQPPRDTTSVRQTTLLGEFGSPATPSTSQARTHRWPLTNKVEPPTHHKLNLEASKTWIYPTNLGNIRDYQYNIVQRGLFHNLLVALPTGLGKTFIAATIMLNWFRWTVDAQIVFVAPTKPLVSQQVEACFGIVGIPRSETTMLTGNVKPAMRAEEWQSKRVFFMTPQTLMHDLKSGIGDPKKLVLLVVDEAHRATGNYAYVEVVRFVRRFNNSFRVLALTATPGASVEAVQNVIDGLDIARVEIRTEESLDIRQFVHTRNIDIELFDNSEELSISLDLFSRALQPVLNQLISLNAYWGRDPSTLTAYGLTVARKQWMSSDAAKKGGFALKGKANAIFTVLASLAHAIELLKFHGIGSFYRNLLNFQTSTSDGTNNGKYAKEIAKNEHFHKLMNRLRAWVGNPDFVGHPKLSYMKTVVLNHFMDAGHGHGAAGGRAPSDTRIMIFVHYRDSAEEVTRVLKRHEPMIRPHVFVGQTGAKASEGMDQKTQLDVIEKFKKGTYNTIVATSIGEEGLDIGEVDLIVCYDSSASPIRMLQRMGRTGRKRAGNIVLLLMKGKEENSYTKAKDNYEKMQHMIADGSRFTFHDEKSPRIIPKEIHPIADKRVVDIPVENSQVELPEPRKRSKTTKRPPKKFHMPDGVQTGFVQASFINGKHASTQPPNSHVEDAVEVATLPSLNSVLLSNKEEMELDQRYCNVGGDTPQYVHRPRLDAFPVSQRKARPTSKVGHSRLTQRLVKCLDTMQRPFDHVPPLDLLTDFERASNTSSRAKKGVILAQQSTQSSTGLCSSPAIAESSEGLSEGEESPAGNSAKVQGDHRQHRLEISTQAPTAQQISQAREEHPFYVSQKSDITHDESDDDLPDVDNLVSRRKHQRATSRTAEGVTPTPARTRRRKRPMVLGESDDD
jgi:ATP-dependent DNA helicase MPH1